MNSKRATARRLAHESLKRGDAAGWFETLYDTANGEETIVPWADVIVNPNFYGWLSTRNLSGTEPSALVVGCGLGDDAEELARLGFQAVAFDISPTAVAWCRRRFPHSDVDFCVADLFSTPKQWRHAFDFVFEAYTLQVLPENLQTSAIRKIAEFVSPGGTLLVITRGRDATDPSGEMPWPVLKETLRHFEDHGLNEVMADDETPPVRRYPRRKPAK